MSKKILLIDDEESIINSIRRLLRTQTDCDIDSTTVADEVDKKLAEGNPELVIVDVMMPGIDGFEVVRRIKSNPESAHVKVISLSGNYPEGGKLILESMGVLKCLDKPFQPEEFVDTVNDILSGYINE